MKMGIRQDIAIKVFLEDGTILMNKKDTKINRNDMLELTRRMTLSRNCFVRTAGAYIDDEGYIDNTFNVSFKNMSKHDQQVNLDLAKTIPFSKTNEQLKCYKFPEGDMAYDSIHKLLMALSQYGLKDDLLVQTLCEQLAEGICDTKDSSDKINRLQGQEFGIYSQERLRPQRTVGVRRNIQLPDLCGGSGR